MSQITSSLLLCAKTPHVRLQYVDRQKAGLKRDPHKLLRAGIISAAFSLIPTPPSASLEEKGKALSQQLLIDGAQGQRSAMRGAA